MKNANADECARAKKACHKHKQMLEHNYSLAQSAVTNNEEEHTTAWSHNYSEHRAAVTLNLRKNWRTKG